MSIVQVDIPVYAVFVHDFACQRTPGQALQRQGHGAFFGQQREGMADFILGGKVQPKVGNGPVGTDVRLAQQRDQFIVAGFADGENLLPVPAEGGVQIAAVGVQGMIAQRQPEGTLVSFGCLKGVVNV